MGLTDKLAELTFIAGLNIAAFMFIDWRLRIESELDNETLRRFWRFAGHITVFNQGWILVNLVVIMMSTIAGEGK